MNTVTATLNIRDNKREIVNQEEIEFPADMPIDDVISEIMNKYDAVDAETSAWTATVNSFYFSPELDSFDIYIYPRHDEG